MGNCVGKWVKVGKMGYANKKDKLIHIDHLHNLPLFTICSIVNTCTKTPFFYF